MAHQWRHVVVTLRSIKGGGGDVNLHFNDFMRSHSRIKILKVIQPSLHCSGILRLWTLSGASF